VKEIVKAHGGKISISSDGEKEGTTFKIELPVYNESKKRSLKRFSNKKEAVTDG
jgi:signal transduction histidine kinase